MKRIMEWLMEPKESRKYFTVKPRDFFSRLMAAKKSLNIYIDPYGHFCMLWFEQKNVCNTFVSEKGLVWRTLKKHFSEEVSTAVDKENFSWLREIKWDKAKEIFLSSTFKDYLQDRSLVKLY